MVNATIVYDAVDADKPWVLQTPGVRIGFATAQEARDKLMFWQFIALLADTANSIAPLLDRGVILGSQSGAFVEATVGDDDIAALVGFGIYLTPEEVIGLIGLVEQVISFMIGLTVTPSGQPVTPANYKAVIDSVRTL